MSSWPPPRRGRPGLGRIAVLSLLVAAAAAAGLSDARAAPGPSAGLARYAIGSEADLGDPARTARRHQVIVLQAWEHGRIAELKRSNPTLRVLVYKNLSMAIRGRGPQGLSSTGVNEDEAPDEWFLKDGGGSRFTSSGYDFLWAMDVGNRSYQRRWAENVAGEVERGGWDGVFLDDVNPTMKYHHPDPEGIRGYPTDRAYARATASALAEITPRLRAGGRLAIANTGAWVEYPADGNAFLDHLDGAMDEMFTRFSAAEADGRSVCTARDESQWRDQLAEVQSSGRRGKVFIGIAQACPDDDPHERESAARFGYATILLGGEGRALFSLAAGDYNDEYSYPGYSLGAAIGRPTTPAVRLPNGVWRRGFEHGLVLVNPGDAAATVSFGGAYSGWGLDGVATSGELPSHGALVLRRVPATP